MNNILKRYRRKENELHGFQECELCCKITPKKELAENKQFPAYGNKEICNRCAEAIEDKLDNDDS